MSCTFLFRQQVEQRFTIPIKQPAEQLKKEKQELNQLFQEHMSAVLHRSLRLSGCYHTDNFCPDYGSTMSERCQGADLFLFHPGNRQLLRDTVLFGSSG